MHVQAAINQAARQGRVAAKKRGQLRPQGHPGRAGQRGHVDQQIGFAFSSVGQGVAQDDAAFGIGVTNLDVQAFARFEDITGAKGIACDGVFYRRYEQLQMHGQLERHHQLRQAKRRGRTAHVLLHPAHAVGAFDVQATAVKTNALANKAQTRMLGVAPVQLDQARRARGGTAHGMHTGEVFLQ